MVIVNHQSTGDVCTLMMCLQDKGTVRPAGSNGLRLYRFAWNWTESVDRKGPFYLGPHLRILTRSLFPTPYRGVIASHDEYEPCRRRKQPGPFNYFNLSKKTHSLVVCLLTYYFLPPIK